MLNFNDANAGLDLIANGELAPIDKDELSPRTRRLIERLLDQIDAQGRQPTESEDTYLRRSIYLCQIEEHVEAISYAFRAAEVGDRHIAGQFDEPDRTIPLRSLLLQTSA
jgi:hypothetical protein